jgi:hypothetical protein
MSNWRTFEQALLQSLKTPTHWNFRLQRFFIHNTTLHPNSEVENPRTGASPKIFYFGTPEVQASEYFSTQNHNSPECRIGELLWLSLALKLQDLEDIKTKHSTFSKH